MTVNDRNQPTAQDKAQEKQKENEDAAKVMHELEASDLPTDLGDWPSGPAKYLTFGNEENEVYGEGVTEKLGPANLKRFDDGSITIDDRKVENPDDYRGEPLVGGPTDSKAPS